MKLARPDVFHPRIVLAGHPRHVAGDGDDAGLVLALRQRGLAARWLPWDDPDVAAAHLVILRDVGDYPQRLDEFLAWTTGATGVRNLLNPPSVVGWNADHRYLDDLAERGVPVVAVEVCQPGERVQLPNSGRIYVGPIVGSGVRRFSDRSAAAGYIDQCHQAGRGVLVQAGRSDPEAVLVFLGGKPSHAFIQQDHGLREGEADFELWDVGAGALAAAADRAHVGVDELLYARVHLAGERVVELQLVDPGLGWRRLSAHTRDRAQREFAIAVESALERLNLGPFSHRRP